MHETSPKLRAVRGKLGNGDAVERFAPATGTRTHSNRGARKLEGRARAGVQLPCGCSGDGDAQGRQGEEGEARAEEAGPEENEGRRGRNRKDQARLRESV